jgi:solute carrier family 25 protein 44
MEGDETYEESNSSLKDVNWNDMNKAKFYGYSAISLITVRATLYPLSLIKTRLQIQENVKIENENL